MNENFYPEMFQSEEFKRLFETKEEHVTSDKKPIKPPSYIDAGESYWHKKGSAFLNFYKKGELINNFNAISQFDHLTVFLGLCRALEEVLRDEFKSREIDFTNIKESIKIIESSFKLISSNIEKEIKEKQKSGVSNESAPIDVNSIFSIIHGFVTSYIQKNGDE